MKIDVEKNGEAAILHLSGKIDENGADELKKSFNNLDTAGLTKVVVDFRDVTYVGSSGIGKLLLFYKNLGVKHVKLKVTGVPGAVYDIFKELKLDTIFLVEKL